MMRTYTLKNRSKLRYAACFVVILLVLTALLPTFTSCKLFSSEIIIKHLDIMVDVGADGVTTFTESARAKFTEQDTDWWNFYRVIDDKKLISAISREGGGFSIDAGSFSLDGKQIPFEGAIDLNEDGAKKKALAKYSSPVGYFYARESGLEIGVIMPEFSSGTHTISYSYSVKSIVTDIADASVFYYKYLSEINTMDVEKMSVTVNFAKAEDDLRGWLHVSQGATGIWKQNSDKKSVTIEVEDISAGEYVESRFLMEKGTYAASSIDQSKTAQQVVEEETAWQKKYEREQRLRLAVTILDYLLGALAIGGGVLYVFYAKKKNQPMDLPGAPIYYRDIPEGYTGGEVSPLYFYYSNENYIDESISATMLELVRLKYISIAPDEGKKNAVITVLKKDEEDELRTHQKLVVEMLLMVKPIETPFTMKEFEKYAKAHYDRFMHIVEKYKAAILNKSQRDGAYRKDNFAKQRAQSFAIKMIGFGLGVIVLSGFTSFILGAGMTFFGAGLIIGGGIAYLMMRKAKAPLTLVGQKEYNNLRALGKYMQEFSLMKEHEIPELTLWEDYMIFATAMGIADKVAEQLEIVYPEFKELSARGFDMDADRFLVLYFFSRSFRGMTGLNFVGNIANVIRSVEIAQKAAKAAQMASKIGGSIGGGGRGGGSSFHGGGGGFSGGGFGGRR